MGGATPLRIAVTEPILKATGGVGIPPDFDIMRADSSGQPRPLLLLVDDNPQIRQLLSEVGHREGFEVLEAADGTAALEMLQRRHMDLVLLDLHMPRANGLDVLRAVRAAGSSSQIALMSGAANVEDAVEAIKLGASEYFSKPLDMPRVRELMRAMRQQFLDRNSVLDSDATLAAPLINASCELDPDALTARRTSRPFSRGMCRSSNTRSI